MEVVRSGTLLRVSGEVDTHSAQELQQSLLDQALVSSESVVVDMSGVTFMDSAGLTALVAAAQRVPVQVVHPSDPVATLLFVTRLEDQFGV